MENNEFVGHYFRRVFRVPSGAKLGENLPLRERRDFLLKVYDWQLKNLSQFNKCFAYETLDEILQIGIELNEFDEKLFIAYLKNPGRRYGNTTKET